MKTTKIQDSVKTFEQAFDLVKADPTARDWIKDIVSVEKAEQVPAWLRIFVIAKALNENWTPDWNNSSEYKYYPWFKQNPSSVGFVCGVYAYYSANTDVGSRLCYKSRELAGYAAEQFEKEYNDYLLIQ